MTPNRDGAPRGVFDPRRLLRPLRLLAVAGAVMLVFFLLPDYALLRVPEGASPVYDVAAGDRLLVEPSAGGAPARGATVVWRTVDGALRLGRLVALQGDALQLENDTVLAPALAQRFPLPPRAAARLPLQSGEALILAERPEASQQGAVVPLGQIVGRVVTRLPF